MNHYPIWAVIPVKPLQRSKSRLASVLSAEERVELMHTMFRHVLSVLQQIPAITQCLIVSRDKAVCQVAKSANALTFTERSPLNLNQAIADAVAYAYEQGAFKVLVLPSDLPLLTVPDVELVLVESADVVIVPDRRYDGTNGLLLRAKPDFRFKYGEDSFTRHLAEAARVGDPARVVFADSIEFDLDTPADWFEYQARLNV